MPSFPRLRAKSPDTTPVVSYCDEVMALLVGVFPGLAAEPHTYTVVADAIRDQVARPSTGFEVIIDHPSAANWRLKSASQTPGRFRVADYRLIGTCERPDIDALNESLEQTHARFAS